MTSSPPSPKLDRDSERLARDYEELSTTRQVEGGRQLAAALGIAPGERELDVGCGTGLVTGLVADLVGPSGYVLGIDPLPARIELARTKARPNLAFEVGDARDLSAIAGSSFDVVFLNAVLHWLPEKTGPLKAFARVLRRGGRLGITTTPKDEDNILYRTLFGTFKEPPFDRHPRTRDGTAARVDAADMRALFASTGFTPTLIEMREGAQRYATPEAAVRFVEASSFGNTFAHLPAELVPLARARMIERLAAVMGPHGIVVKRHRLLALAKR